MEEVLVDAEWTSVVPREGQWENAITFMHVMKVLTRGETTVDEGYKLVLTRD